MSTYAFPTMESLAAHFDELGRQAAVQEAKAKLALAGKVLAPARHHSKKEETEPAEVPELQELQSASDAWHAAASIVRNTTITNPQ